MKRLLSLAVLLCGYVSAQTINPNQIKPATSNNQVLTTETANTPPVWAAGGGSGCTPISSGGDCVTDDPTVTQDIIQPGSTDFEIESSVDNADVQIDKNPNVVSIFGGIDGQGEITVGNPNGDGSSDTELFGNTSSQLLLGTLQAGATTQFTDLAGPYVDIDGWTVYSGCWNVNLSLQCQLNAGQFSRYYWEDATSGNLTLTLPPACPTKSACLVLDHGTNQVIEVFKIDSSGNTVTTNADPSASDTLLGGSVSLSAQNQGVEFTSDGNHTWRVTNTYPLSGGSGSGTVSNCSTQFAFFYAATTGTTATCDPNLTDNGSVFTITEPAAIASAGASQWGFTYNATPIVPGSSTTFVIGANSSGQGVMSETGGTAARICDATNGVCSGSSVTWPTAGEVVVSNGTSSPAGLQKVLYASQIVGVTPGVAVIPGSSATSTTDSAGPINTAIASGNVDLEVDSGFALSTSLVLASNTTIHCTSPQYGFIMQTASNAPVLVNKDQTAPTTSSGTGGFLVSNQTDNNIRVVGCMLNGNSIQAVTGSGNVSGTPHTTNPATGLAVYGVTFASVNGLWFEKNEVYDTGQYSVPITNVSNFHINSNYIHQPQPTTQLKNTDGIDILGPAINGEVNSNTITSGDDAIAFNAEGCIRSGEADCQIPNWKWGPEQHISAKDNKFSGASNGLRILDASELIDDLNINNTQGTVCSTAMIGGEYSPLNSFGSGNISRVNIDGWKVQTTGTCNVFGGPYNFVLGLNAQDFEISNVQNSNPAVNWPLLTTLTGQGIIQTLSFSFHVTTTSSTFSPDIVNIGTGSVNHFISNDSTWYDTVGTGIPWGGSGPPTTTTISGYIGRGINTIPFSASVSNGDFFALSETNGTNNTNPTGTNFITSTVNADALIVTPLNPSINNEKFEISGNYTGILGNSTTATTQTTGDNTTKVATDAFVLANAGGVSGAGIVTYSGPSLTFTGTLFFPIGGGAVSSTTETNVDIPSPAAATVQNFSVQMSAAPGVGNSVAYTWRKNASSTTLTCTISGSSATSCDDLTHTLTVAQGDLMDVQAVTTGTIVGTPTVIMGTQFGIAASGSGITQLTGDGTAGPGSGSQALTLATVNSSPGSCGDSTHVCQITTNGKGLTTAQTAVAISGAGSGALVNLLTLGSPPSVACTGSGCSVSISGGALVVGVAATTITISSIPSGYQDLEFSIAGQNSTTAAEGVQLQFNSDATSGHYGYNVIFNSTGTTVLAAAVASSTFTNACGLNGTTNGTAGGGKFAIVGYTSSFEKTVNGECSANISGTGAPFTSATYGGFWTQTSAITSVTFTLGTGNYVAGTIITLHATQ